MNARSELLDPRTLARLERVVRIARRVAPQRRRRPLLKRPGRGVEIGARRPYAPGDDLRLVDWPAYARLERLFVKVQEELPEPRLSVLLDGSASMGPGGPSLHTRACLAAAGVIAAAVAREVWVTVHWAGEVPARLELRRPGELVRLLRFLAERRPAGTGRLLAAGTRLAEATRARGACLVMSDGLDEGLLETAARLRRAGYELLVLLLRPAEELAPERAAPAEDAGWVELVDAETGARRQAPWGPAAQAQAARARAERLRALTSALEERGISVLRLDPEPPFEEVALRLLRP